MKRATTSHILAGRRKNNKAVETMFSGLEKRPVSTVTAMLMSDFFVLCYLGDHF